MGVEHSLPQLPMFSWVAWLSYPTLQEALALGGFRIVRFDGSGVINRETFFNQARRDLPLNPPGVRWSWDALSDSLWNGISELGEERVAVVWLHADMLLTRDAGVLFEALEVFRDVAITLYEPRERRDLVVVLVGTGPSFKPFRS